MDDLAGKQYLALEPLLHVGFVGDLREDGFKSEMNALQVEVLDLVHLSHSPSRDEANDDKAAPEDVARVGPVSGIYRTGWVAAGGFRVVANISSIYGGFVEEIRRLLLGRASGPRIFDQQEFEGTAELQISAADLFEKGAAVPGLDCQGGIEELLDQLLLISHNPRSNKTSRIRRLCAEAVPWIMRLTDTDETRARFVVEVSLRRKNDQSPLEARGAGRCAINPAVCSGT